MAATHILEKRIYLGSGFSYHEVVKPRAATVHQLKQYIVHDACDNIIGDEAGRGMPDLLVCWACGKEAPQDVIEKGMTILSMRVL